ncbi:hypothetical protein ONZ51_g6894 [Trametes cubensis]|uniref:Peptidase S28 n=1 Tax=Trametes cubensis TaxID=1111947 RepID=A0AAD7XAP8_9APHY|nr:hypothetical protein ONZ51_g6894 [Trametes cubensis]
MARLIISFVPFLLAGLVSAIASPWSHSRPGMRQIDAVSHEVFHKTNGTKLPPLNTTYYFDQLIDHDNPSLGTFKQRYWLSYQYYEPGGPIVLMNGGEGDASSLIGYLTNLTMVGYTAEQLRGAAVLLEHRFFGESNPYPDLSVKSFCVHTIEQAINDHEYFVKNVQLPMLGGDHVSAPNEAAWILFGGSYSGALTSFTMTRKPGLFAAGYASSAVVQAISDYWAYYEPIREYLAPNCTADIEAVVNYMDGVLTSGNASAIKSLKDSFGLGAVEHNDDFAWIFANVPQSWQSYALSIPGGPMFEFCDAMEVKDGKVSGPNGWGLDHALAAWIDYYNSTYFAGLCGSTPLSSCFSSYDTQDPSWSNTTVNNWIRSWNWLTCTQFGFWHDGAPADRPSLVSRLITPAYFERQCKNNFPEAFSSPPVTFLDAMDVNKQYGGWNTTVERVVFLNGRRDPWREATVAADGTTNPGSELQPHLLGDGYHTGDTIIAEGLANPSVRAAQQQALQYIGKWLADWKPSS